jgi:hypothetical protein
MRHQPPRISGLHDVAHRVEQSPQIVLSRGIVLATQYHTQHTQYARKESSAVQTS